jgi:hypothetical protein
VHGLPARDGTDASIFHGIICLMIGFHLGASTTLDFIVGRIPVMVLSANGGQIIVSLFKIDLPL